MSTRAIRNIFACLVHEAPGCIIDLVRNLHHLDPNSTILLYNGGANPDLFRGFPYERFGAVIHPAPQPMQWGTLHTFALDCMRFALEQIPFDTLTIVDSDQLALRPGYSDYLASHLDGQDGLGMLGNAPWRQGPDTTIPPARTAHLEIDLWRPFLRRFPSGEAQYVHWTFWPSTIFTAEAAQALVHFFDTNTQLHRILAKSRIWATEEVILPTLVKLLGFEIGANPCSYDFVKFRAAYPKKLFEQALAQSDAYWMHPVPRRIYHPLRTGISAAFGRYASRTPALHAAPLSAAGLLLNTPILERMSQVEGELGETEADLLIATTAQVLRTLPTPHALVEVGSYCGRTTVVLGGVVKALGGRASIFAIDPHDGKRGALDQGYDRVPPSRDILERNLAEAGLEEVVEVMPHHAVEIPWDHPVSLLLIDGLHDYASVARDFYHFEEWVVPGGYIVFQAYMDAFPDVKHFVHELLAREGYRKIHQAGTLMVLQKRAPVLAFEAHAAGREPRPKAVAQPIAHAEPRPVEGGL